MLRCDDTTNTNNTICKYVGTHCLCIKIFHRYFFKHDRVTNDEIILTDKSRHVLKTFMV